MWRRNTFAIALVIAAGISPAAHAVSETVIYSFSRNANPVPPSVQAPNGALYGLAHNAGRHGQAYRLIDRGGTWKDKLLYQFAGHRDGEYPTNMLKHDGVLYGVTASGGRYGAGTVFSLARSGTSWTESVLYSFTGGADGSDPDSGLL